MSAVAVTSPGSRELHGTRWDSMTGRVVTWCRFERVYFVWLSREAATVHQKTKPKTLCHACEFGKAVTS